MGRKVIPVKVGLLDGKHIHQLGGRTARWEFDWCLISISFEVMLQSGEKIGFVKGGRPVPNSEIAEALTATGFPRTEITVRRMMARLEKYDYIYRPPNPGFARPILVRKSDRWQKLSQYVRKLPWEKITELCEGLRSKVIGPNGEPRSEVIRGPITSDQGSDQLCEGSYKEVDLKESRKRFAKDPASRESQPRKSNPDADTIARGARQMADRLSGKSKSDETEEAEHAMA